MNDRELHENNPRGGLDSDMGMMRVAAAVPDIRLADARHNAREIADLARAADAAGAGIVLFPELCLTGYSCGDLFCQKRLLDSQNAALRTVLDETAELSVGLILGAFVRVRDRLFSCALYARGGRVFGVVPKTFVPNTKEFYEARWFCSGADLPEGVRRVDLFGESVPFGRLVFRDAASGLVFGAEICEDLWAPVTPGAVLALNGAHILFNPSASPDIVGKAAYRRELVNRASASGICGYVYASAGSGESTTDLVFGGHALISENGVLLAESTLFDTANRITVADLDYERLIFEREQSRAFSDCSALFARDLPCETVDVAPLRVLGFADALTRRYPRTPFVPDDRRDVDARCDEILAIQATGLARRVERAGAARLTVGVSGGLDSTLALLVCVAALRRLGREPACLTAVTMPGFGTTDATYENAVALIRLLGASLREIPIREAVLSHFADIGHDPAVLDHTYENAQARERTQILMDIANRENGLVVGTGDLSEAALGWCTYNGDHMSMYGVNASIPKTLVRHLIRRFAERADGESFAGGTKDALAEVLRRVLDTPISPELLPPDAQGHIRQRTEDEIGPYVLHDFFLYHTLRGGMTPKKLLRVATDAFGGEYDGETVLKYLKVFYSRFFSQQFKRSCMPDGPKVGTVSLSPRGDWRMPSDATARAWLSEIEGAGE